MTWKLCSSALLAVVLLVSCSGDDDDASSAKDDDTTTLDDIATATAAEESVELDGTRTLDDASGPVAGVFAADPAAGQLTAPVFLPDGAVEPVEVRLVDGSA